MREQKERTTKNKERERRTALALAVTKWDCGPTKMKVTTPPNLGQKIGRLGG